MYNAGMSTKPLTPTVFYILLALSEQDRHGYDILKRSALDSEGQVRMAAGTLYNALQRLVDDGLVVEAGERPAPERDDERRRYYTLTERGRQALVAEVERMGRAVQRAEEQIARGRKGRTTWTT